MEVMLATSFLGLEIGSWSSWIFGISSFFVGGVSLYVAMRNPKLKLSANSYKENGKAWVQIYNGSKGEGVVKVERGSCKELNQSASLWYPIHAKDICVIELMEAKKAESIISKNATDAVYLTVRDDRKSRIIFELQTAELSNGQATAISSICTNANS
ncbi:hypothetical protein ORR04_02800 [Levilactobacillus brevis]|uniref:Uncharacterized protein n=1 Tax=Levilactobacillus brevis TaxID=1580 RepID=A0AB38X6C9_LEVBR|nr:hypothetical protein [Levilactobacillus brevis]WAD02145.1 hypothetical protein ORR04_02800 [Levilactobacillus brevis]